MCFLRGLMPPSNSFALFSPPPPAYGAGSWRSPQCELFIALTAACVRDCLDCATQSIPSPRAAACVSCLLTIKAPPTSRVKSLLLSQRCRAVSLRRLVPSLPPPPTSFHPSLAAALPDSDGLEIRPRVGDMTTQRHRFCSCSGRCKCSGCRCCGATTVFRRPSATGHLRWCAVVIA